MLNIGPVMWHWALNVQDRIAQCKKYWPNSAATEVNYQQAELSQCCELFQVPIHGKEQTLQQGVEPVTRDNQAELSYIE